MILAAVVMGQGPGAIVAVPVLVGLLLVTVLLTGDPPGAAGG